MAPAALVCAALAVLAVTILRPAEPVRAPTLTFIDVGQGDACLIRLPNGANVLVDGGGSPRAPCRSDDCAGAAPGTLARSLRTDCLDVGRDVLARYLRHEHVRRLDLLVLTHPHDDHLWGLNALLDAREGFEVRAVLDAGQAFDSVAHREWTELLRRRGLTPIVGRRGTRLSMEGVGLTVLHPPPRFLRGTRSDENNNSVVLRLDLPGTRVLLAGDAEAEAEDSMSGEELRADVLKLGHHGSATSTGEAWLQRVRPRIAVISCGPRNLFGHPRRVTLDRLRRQGAEVYRTDQDGAVTLVLDRYGWKARRTIDAGATGPSW
jgi:competence protein ComEC